MPTKTTQKPLCLVTGPGLPDAGLNADSPGAALSRSLTAAVASKVDGTWYAWGVDGERVGYSERSGKTVLTWGRP